MRTLLLIAFIGIQFSMMAQQHRNCGTMNYLDSRLANDATLAQKMKSQEAALQKYIHSGISEKSVITIPVIIHVLWASNQHNISDAQVYSQIEVLNEDYRRMNMDTSDTPNDFDSLATDVEIEFCVAHQDPSGNWTNGITRTQVTKTSFDMSSDEAKYNSKGGVDAWDTRYYLNIWVVPSITEGGQSGILGYAQFPGDDPATDGVVIGYNYFGNMGSVSSPYDLGRTTTHEVGHWLDLYHIWGDDNGACWGTDHVDDTPNQGNYHFGCPNHPAISCSNNGDMFMNYMDYTDDDCMNMFSLGQKERMVGIMNTTRLSLKNSGKCQANAIEMAPSKIEFSIMPNPAKDLVQLKWDNSNNTDNLVIQILDLSGHIVYTNTVANSTQNLEINTSELSSGLYIIQIQNNALMGVQKLMIQH